MILDIAIELNYEITAATDLILQIELPDLADQTLRSDVMDLSDTLQMAEIPGEDGFGKRRLIRAERDLVCTYQARVEVRRPALDIAALPATPPHRLPAAAIRHLMPSRYCQSDQLQNFVAAEFGGTVGGARIAAMRDWIFERYAYAPGASNAGTTAIDTFAQRRGVCRDFAHVLVTLARASAIPARFVSVYAPFVEPQDFHAVAEVFLDGAWHLVDATGMAAANQIARVGVGADAAEVPFLAAFGPVVLQPQSVRVDVVSS